MVLTSMGSLACRSAPNFLFISAVPPVRLKLLPLPGPQAVLGQPVKDECTQRGTQPCSALASLARNELPGAS